MSSHIEVAIVSPHRDDAAFSCGILMSATLAEMGLRIVNVFTNSAYAPFDPTTEQSGVGAVTNLRRNEDAAAFRFLQEQAGASGQIDEVDLGLLDAPLRLDVVTENVQGMLLDASEYEQEVEKLASELEAHLKFAGCVLLPLGLGGRALYGHIDHRIARDAGRLCTASDRIAFYEDLPYAARMKEDNRESAIAAFTAAIEGMKPTVIEYPNAGTLKAMLAGFYTSQVDAGTIAEIARYTSQQKGERVYASTAALRVLESM